MLQHFNHDTAGKEREKLVEGLQSILDFLDSETENSDSIDKIRSEVEALPKLWEQVEQEYLREKMNAHVDSEELDHQLDFLLGEEVANAMVILNEPWSDLLEDSVLGSVLKSLPKTSKLFREVFKLFHSSLTQARIGEIMDLSQPAVRQRVAEAKCLLPFMVGLERLDDDLNPTERTLTPQFMPNKSSRRLKMPVKSHAVFSIGVNGDLVAKLFCLAPIDETDLTDQDERRAGLQQRIKQVEKESPDVPLLMYQFPIDSLELIFSEPASFMDTYPNSLRPRSLQRMKRRGVEVWGSFWDWQNGER